MSSYNQGTTVTVNEKEYQVILQVAENQILGVQLPITAESPVVLVTV